MPKPIKGQFQFRCTAILHWSNRPTKQDRTGCHGMYVGKIVYKTTPAERRRMIAYFANMKLDRA